MAKKLATAVAAASHDAPERRTSHPRTTLMLGPVSIEVSTVPVATARRTMADLMHAADGGKAFLIQNARNATAAPALLIDPSELDRRISLARPDRMLADVLDQLPFRRRRTPALSAAVPDDTAPILKVAVG